MTTRPITSAPLEKIMVSTEVPLTFRIFKDNQLLREERLSLRVIKLGKVASAHLKFDDEAVNRMHAFIEVNGPGDITIIDLGSTKGTFVNGQKVIKAKLRSGDMIRIGETWIELVIDTGEELSREAATIAGFPDLHVTDGAIGIRTSQIAKPVHLRTLTVSGKGNVGIDLDDGDAK
jgi:pSer/pThr/pTyr-binding forkhead associated (FHA) protein